MAEQRWRITTHKYWLGVGGIPWANTYEAYTNSAVLADDGALANLTNALVAAERIIHHTNVFFDRATISTWDPEGPVYDPEALSVINYGVMGQRNTLAEQKVDLNAVYNVKRTAQFGRAGKLAYRGVLVESDVNATASGFWQLDPASGLATGGDLFMDYRAALVNYLIGGGEGVVLSLIGQYGTAEPVIVTRPVTDLVPQGAGFNRMNHKWYDRG